MVTKPLSSPSGMRPITTITHSNLVSPLTILDDSNGHLLLQPSLVNEMRLEYVGVRLPFAGVDISHAQPLGGRRPHTWSETDQREMRVRDDERREVNGIESGEQRGTGVVGIVEC